jgi:hypothetical protein
MVRALTQRARIVLVCFDVWRAITAHPATVCQPISVVRRQPHVCRADLPRAGEHVGGGDHPRCRGGCPQGPRRASWSPSSARTTPTPRSTTPWGGARCVSLRSVRPVPRKGNEELRGSRTAVLLGNACRAAQFLRGMPRPQRVTQPLAAEEHRSASPLARSFSACPGSAMRPDRRCRPLRAGADDVGVCGGVVGLDQRLEDWAYRNARRS